MCWISIYIEYILRPHIYKNIICVTSMLALYMALVLLLRGKIKYKKGRKVFFHKHVCTHPTYPISNTFFLYPCRM